MDATHFSREPLVQGESDIEDREQKIQVEGVTQNFQFAELAQIDKILLQKTLVDGGEVAYMNNFDWV